MFSISKWHITLFFSIAFVMMDCGIAKRTIRPPAGTVYSHQAKSHSNKSGSYSLPPPAYAVSKYKEVEVSLKQAYRDWKGTPYVWGGESHNGVDCSGLMQMIFRRYFGVKLPRVTQRQLYTGTFVPRKDLKSGDLVFFDTGRKELHVGVIVHGSKFLNASVSKGVTMSSLNNPYWNSHYMTARRVMEF